MRAVLGDWEIAGILGAGTGQPFTAYTGGLGSGLTGGPSGTGFTDNQRPNRVSGEPCRASSGPDEQIINPRAYTLDGFRLGTIGSAERGDCTGPGYFQTDLAFYKNFPLKNGMKMQFRWDIFNIFNNTNFLFQNLDATMDPSAVVLNAAQTEIVQRHDSRQFRPGHTDAGSAADADRLKAALVELTGRGDRLDRADLLAVGPGVLSRRDREGRVTSQPRRDRPRSRRERRIAGREPRHVASAAPIRQRTLSGVVASVTGMRSSAGRARTRDLESDAGSSSVSPRRRRAPDSRADLRQLAGHSGRQRKRPCTAEAVG